MLAPRGPFVMGLPSDGATCLGDIVSDGKVIMDQVGVLPAPSCWRLIFPRQETGSASFGLTADGYLVLGELAPQVSRWRSSSSQRWERASERKEKKE